MNSIEIIKKALGVNGLERFADDQTCEKLALLSAHMLEVNEYMNLTAIKDEYETAVRHFADSLTAEDLIPEGASVADIGTGAGFPALPLSLCRKDIKVCAIDSTEKKIKYVAETAKLLGSGNLTAIAGRAEEIACGNMRESFDTVISRGVASLPVLCELCLPLVKVGGYFIAMKGASGKDEADAAQNAIKALGGERNGSRTRRFSLHREENDEGDERYLIVIRKVSQTNPKYPRKYAKIVKNPL